MATMKDVAKTAGVSVATVSNYINTARSVSINRSERIAEAIDVLHYVPNQMAKTLKSNRNNSVGVILPNISDNYYVQIFQGIEHYLNEKGYFVNIGISNDLPEIERKYLFYFLKNKVMGFIVVTSQPNNSMFFTEHIFSKYIPFVHIDRQLTVPDTTFLTFDNKKTLNQLTDYFKKKGKHRITLIAGSKLYSCEKDAVEGYLAALNKNDTPYIVHTMLNKEAAFRSTVLHLKENKPEVIITTSKLVTQGVLESLSIAGYQVPNDVIVATLGEDDWNRYNGFQSILSTARESIMMGSEAARLILSQIEAPKVYEPHVKVFEDKCNNFNILLNNNSVCTYNNKAHLNVMMLDTLQSDLFEGLLPYFKNACQSEINIEKIPHHRLLSEIYHDEGRFDVYMYDMPWLYSLANDGILSDISCYIESESFKKDIYLKDSLDVYGKFRGRYYGLPFMYAPQILFYRRDIFENRTIRNEFYRRYNIKFQPPRSFKEFNIISDFLRNDINPLSPTKYGTAVPAAYEECLIPEIYMRMRSYGSRIYDQEFKVVFDTSQTVKAYANFEELLKCSVPDYMTLNDMIVVDEFLNGNIAMLITYPSFISNINDLQRNCQTGQVGIANIPGKSPILGGWCLGISDKSNNKEKSFDFIYRACGEEMANYSTIMAGQSAIAKVFDNNELISLYPWLPLYKNIYDYAEPIIPPFASNRKPIPQNKIDSIVAQWLYKLIDGTLSIEDTICRTHIELCGLFHSYGYRQE